MPRTKEEIQKDIDLKKWTISWLEPRTPPNDMQLQRNLTNKYYELKELIKELNEAPS